MCYMSVMPFVKPGVTNSIENPFLHHLFHCYSKKINKKNLTKMFKRRSSKMLTSVICQVVYIKKRNFARWLFDWGFRTKEGMGVSFMTKLTFRLNFAWTFWFKSVFWRGNQQPHEQRVVCLWCKRQFPITTSVVHTPNCKNVVIEKSKKQKDK